MASSPAAETADAARPWWKRWWAGLLILPALLLGFGLLLTFFVLFSTVPLPDEIGARSTVVLDYEGNEVGALNAQAARSDINLDDLPDHVANAVLAAEDRGFYDHAGISPASIVRAVLANVRAGGIAQGGSTISQQYVKNAVVGSDRTIIRKIREAALTIKLEGKFDKPTILEMYLNSIYWGRGAYGVESAAQTYFTKPAADLTVNEAATLAGLIQAPGNLDPVEHPERAETRRVYVLDGMLEQGWLESDEHETLVAEGMPEVTERSVVNLGPNAYFLDAVRRELSAELGEQRAFNGLRVYTTLDTNVQAAAETALEEALEDQAYTGAIASVDPSTGAIRAIVGGPDMSIQPYNLAIRDGRQAGSAFKPATLAAFVEEGYSPESVFSAPAQITVPDGNGGTRDIPNYGGQSYGKQTVQQATRTSTNTVYIQLQEEVGADAVVDMATRLGLPNGDDGDRPVMEPVPTLTLGVASFTPLEMASAYATLAASGVHTAPHLITRVEDDEGSVIWELEGDSESVMEENDAHIVTDVLRGVISSGTGRAAAIGRPAAGKTGTTNDYGAAWFAGYTPELSTAVLIANLDRSPLDGITGGSVPAAVWSAMMSAALEDVPVSEFPAPDYSGKKVLGAEPESCPDGYQRGDPPSGVDDNGWYPDIQEQSEDAEEQPCIEVSPSPEPSPDPGPTLEPVPTGPSPIVPPPNEPPPPKPTEPSESPSPSPEPSPTPD